MWQYLWKSVPAEQLYPVVNINHSGKLLHHAPHAHQCESCCYKSAVKRSIILHFIYCGRPQLVHCVQYSGFCQVIRRIAISDGVILFCYVVYNLSNLAFTSSVLHICNVTGYNWFCNQVSVAKNGFIRIFISTTDWWLFVNVVNYQLRKLFRVCIPSEVNAYSVFQVNTSSVFSISASLHFLSQDLSAKTKQLLAALKIFFYIY